MVCTHIFKHLNQKKRNVLADIKLTLYDIAVSKAKRNLDACYPQRGSCRGSFPLF